MSAPAVVVDADLEPVRVQSTPTKSQPPSKPAPKRAPTQLKLTHVLKRAREDSSNEDSNNDKDGGSKGDQPDPKRARLVLTKGPPPEPLPRMDEVHLFIPGSLKGVPLRLGIDEAGRGPVLGPMVYASAVAPLDFDDTLRSLGVGDSKQLSEEKRNTLFDVIKTNPKIGYVLHSLSPCYLSNCMLQVRKQSLNAVSHASAMGMIRAVLDKGFDLREVFVDTVGDADRYEARLADAFPGVSVTVRAKADALFPVVSTASICAKVSRDRYVERWHFVEPGMNPSTPRGSGYPGDPDTKKWLQQHVDPVFGYPDIVRFSWSTVKDLLDEFAIAVDWHEDDDPSQMSLSSMFAQPPREQRRPEFFRTLGLESVAEFK